MQNNFFLPALRQWSSEHVTDRRGTFEHDQDNPCSGVLSEQGNSSDQLDLFLAGASGLQQRRIRDFCQRRLGIRELAVSQGGSNEGHIIFWSGDRHGKLAVTPLNLTVTGLREQLLKTQHHSEPLNRPSAPHGGAVDPSQPQSDQRYIYVRHLTPQVICALAATTSKNQLRVLRDFIARHLEFDSHIGVGPITTASSQFSLEFHVPFYALKSRKSQSLDDRGLRNAIDISFLAPPFEVTARIADHEGDTYLQQSQVSFVVSGHDRCAWTGYLFTDIYQSRVESLLAKFNGATLTPPRDPITRGSTDLHAYTSQPREYFIQVLRVTLRETLNEWLSITMKVHDAIARFEDQFGAEKLLAYHITNPSLEDAYRRLTRWMNATSNLLATLIRTLESTVESWNRFTSGSLNYFHDPHGSSNVNVTSRQSLVAMSEHFGILDNLATGLKSDKHVVENLGRLAERQFEHFMQMSTAKAAVSEADNIKALTWITINTLPFALSAAVLSIRDEFLPIGATSIAFPLLTIIIWLATIIQAEFLQSFNFRSKLRESYRSCLDAICTKEQHQGSDSENLDRIRDWVNPTQVQLARYREKRTVSSFHDLERVIIHPDQRNIDNMAEDEKGGSTSSLGTISVSFSSRSTSELSEWSGTDENDDNSVINDPAFALLGSQIVERIWEMFEKTIPCDVAGIVNAVENGCEHTGRADGAQSNTATTGRSQFKRRLRSALQMRIDGDDDGNSEGRHTRSTVRNPPSEDFDWACPFSKFKPIRYEECYQYQLRDVSRVKQHLSRRHKLPLYCATCFMEFENEPIRDQHVAARTSQPRLSQIEGLNSEQQKWLHRRTSPSLSEEERWYEIFHYLFPDADRPDSPFIDRKMSRVILQLQDLVATEGPAMIEESIQDTRNQFLSTISITEDETQMILRWVCRRLILRLVQRTRIRLDPAQETSATVTSLSAPNISEGSSQVFQSQPLQARPTATVPSQHMPISPEVHVESPTWPIMSRAPDTGGEQYGRGLDGTLQYHERQPAQSQDESALGTIDPSFNLNFLDDFNGHDLSDRMDWDQPL